MKKSLIVGLSLFFSASLAFAGLEQPAEVLIVDSGGGVIDAQGDMNTARFDPDDTAFIGCGVRALEVGPGDIFSWGFCQAQDDTVEANVFCSTSDPDMMRVIGSLDDGSFIAFTSVDGVCTYVASSTQSFYILSGQDTKKAKKK